MCILQVNSLENLMKLYEIFEAKIKMMDVVSFELNY